MHTIMIDTLQRHRKKFIAVIAILIISVTAAIIYQPSLETIHNAIERHHHGLSHVTADEYSKLDQRHLVVFDVREPQEYAVSHLNEAIQLSPDVTLEDFIEDHSERLEGKTVIFYCSVGRRSSDVLSRLKPGLENAGVEMAANLKGGIFNWVNQNKTMVGETVHPYNAYWGKLIDDSTKISYSPSQDN